MTSLEIFNHVAELEVKCSKLEQALQERLDNHVDATRFYAVPMTTEEVARLHGVALATVRDYARRGIIELHPNSTDGKMLFRASTALLLDFKELRKVKAEQKR